MHKAQADILRPSNVSLVAALFKIANENKNDVHKKDAGENSIHQQYLKTGQAERADNADAR